MFLTLGNMVETAKVGMLFIDFESPSRVRVNGRASVSLDDPLVSTWPEAILVVRVHVTEVFPNCPRYIHRMQKLEHSRFVPQAGVAPPVPDWKRSEWACEYLPEQDPARGR